MYHIPYIRTIRINQLWIFAFLRQAGIDLIQQLSGKTWTDFNLHDPGVTILESICYALTDLAYRTNFSIVDLLTNKEGIIDNRANSFIGKKQILSTHPVSPKDFCKWIIDAVEEVGNVWIEPVQSAFADNGMKGFYKTTIRIDPTHRSRAVLSDTLDTLKETVAGKVKKLLAQSRNIAEKFDEVVILEPQYLQIAAEIIIGKQAVPEEVLAQIYYRIEQSLNPQVKFYTEPELLSQGYAVEEIYEGPLLQNGIIPDSELSSLNKTVEVSDLIKAVADMDDVIHIGRFHIKEEGAKNYSDRPVVLKPGHYPFLRQQSPDIRLYHDRLPLPVKLAEFDGMLQRLRDTSNRDFVQAIHNATFDKHYQGKYTSPEEYASIQHDFPVTYRLNSQGVESTASGLRKAQVKQLKAYLLFFEQIIANYLSQLANISDLFSPDLSGNDVRTYFFQPIYTIPGVSDLLKPFTEGNYKDWSSFVHDGRNAFIQSLETLTETDETFTIRKNKVFDHLLSRFNIVPDRYPVMLYESLYKPQLLPGRADAELQWKSHLLQQVLYLTKYRYKGYDYLQQNPEDEPGYGLEYNLLRLLYIHPQKRRRLSDVLTQNLQPSYQQPDHQDTEEDQYYAESYHYEEEELKIVDDTSLDYATYRIPNRSIRFLEWGTDEKNYRIVPDPGNPERTFVLYKNPEETYWNIVKAETGYGSAKKSLKKLISTLRQISIDSEGFHIVEHVLLAPSAGERVFGFTFRDESGNPLLREANWLTFEEREEVISKIIRVAAQAAGTASKDWIGQLQGLCDISHKFSASHASFVFLEHLANINAEEASATAYKLLTALQDYSDNVQNFFPRFEFSVLHKDGKTLPEGFYNAEITIVFPSWPLRFQQEGFRRFAEDIFTSHLPVHVKANLLWLDIPKMKHFENLYFDWLQSLRLGEAAERHREATPFIHFLYNELKRT